MKTVNFGKIGDIVSHHFDRDLIDINREVKGSKTLVNVYKNIPVSITHRSVDSAEPTPLETTTKEQSLRIMARLSVDIQNHDFIIAKKISHSGATIATYQGYCGMPYRMQSRQRVDVIMQDKGTPTIEELESAPPIEHAIKPFTSGAFIRNDGSTGFGLHLYKSIVIEPIEKGVFAISDITFFHADIRRNLTLKAADRVMILPEGIIGQISAIERQKDGYKIRYTEVKPTEDEKQAYFTNMYD
ncbi:MAG: hypothetical protein FWG63_05085 [Defluviitaleaceae bacterium]|nr:hypothetical protein [Defluviitaleaceae bacterium]